MYADIGQKSNTMIFSERPADVNTLFAQAAAVLRAHAGSAEGGMGGVNATAEPLVPKKEG